MYEELAANEQGGLVGAITARAEAQMLRLSVTYALADGAGIITPTHLRAAWAVWDYAESSTRYIFGENLGDPVADKLMSALAHAGDDGLDSTQQSALFGRHMPAPRLEAARQALVTAGKAEVVQVQTAGRPRSVLRKKVA